MRIPKLQRVLVLLVLSSIVSSPTAFSQSNYGARGALRDEIGKILGNDRFQNAFWAVLIKEIRSGDTLFERNIHKSMMPASNTKLYTTAAALNVLGPEFRYETHVYTDGEIIDGVLLGNLIVRGSGDPVIGGRFNDGDLTEVFRNWADTLRASGVNRIVGDLIGDDDFFDELPLGSGWRWDYEQYWYAAEISALSFNDNNVDFSIAGQEPGMPGTVTWEPSQTSFIDVTNASITIDADSSLREGYSRKRGTNEFRLFSEVPAGRVDNESLTVRNPTLFFLHVLRESLIRGGIAVSGKPVDVDDLSIKPDYGSNRLRKITTHRSRPLKDIVSVINKRSQNLYAEQVLKTIGAVAPLDDPNIERGSAEMGLSRSMETFAAAGIDTSRIQLVDGSGLSRSNLVTAEMTSDLLTYMLSHPDDSTRVAFLRSLSVGGVDGSLRYRFRDGPAAGKVRAKTGSLSNVVSLSGYVTTARNTALSFVLMCNNYTVPGSEIREAQDRIVELLAGTQY